MVTRFTHVEAIQGSPGRGADEIWARAGIDGMPAGPSEVEADFGYPPTATTLQVNWTSGIQLHVRWGSGLCVWSAALVRVLANLSGPCEALR